MLKPELRHVLKDAGGRAYYLITGRIGERWSFRLVEQPSQVWQIELWNGHHGPS